MSMQSAATAQDDSRKMVSCAQSKTPETFNSRVVHTVLCKMFDINMRKNRVYRNIRVIRNILYRASILSHPSKSLFYKAYFEERSRSTNTTLSASNITIKKIYQMINNDIEFQFFVDYLSVKSGGSFIMQFIDPDDYNGFFAYQCTENMRYCIVLLFLLIFGSTSCMGLRCAGNTYDMNKNTSLRSAFSILIKNTALLDNLYLHILGQTSNPIETCFNVQTDNTNYYKCDADSPKQKTRYFAFQHSIYNTHNFYTNMMYAKNYSKLMRNAWHCGCQQNATTTTNCDVRCKLLYCLRTRRLHEFIRLCWIILDHPDYEFDLHTIQTPWVKAAIIYIIMTLLPKTGYVNDNILQYILRFNRCKQLMYLNLLFLCSQRKIVTMSTDFKVVEVGKDSCLKPILNKNKEIILRIPTGTTFIIELKDTDVHTLVRSKYLDVKQHGTKQVQITWTQNKSYPLTWTKTRGLQCILVLRSNLGKRYTIRCNMSLHICEYNFFQKYMLYAGKINRISSRCLLTNYTSPIQQLLLLWKGTSRNGLPQCLILTILSFLTTIDMAYNNCDDYHNRPLNYLNLNHNKRRRIQ